MKQPCRTLLQMKQIFIVKLKIINVLYDDFIYKTITNTFQCRRTSMLDLASNNAIVLSPYYYEGNVFIVNKITYKYKIFMIQINVKTIKKCF